MRLFTIETRRQLITTETKGELNWNQNQNNSQRERERTKKKSDERENEKETCSKGQDRIEEKHPLNRTKEVSVDVVPSVDANINVLELFDQVLIHDDDKIFLK